MNSECTEFIEAADEQTANWTGLLRIEHEDPEHAQHVQFVCVDEDFENRGPVLFAVASAGTDLGHVAISLHAFVDGKRVTPDVLELGGELIVTIKNA